MDYWGWILDLTEMLAAKALASLHSCTGSPEPRHSNEISCAGSNGDLCTVNVNSECCGETYQQP